MDFCIFFNHIYIFVYFLIIMQERYAGDIHDFFKINFLEFIFNGLRQKIGLNWYLAKPDLLGKNVSRITLFVDGLAEGNALNIDLARGLIRLFIRRCFDGNNPNLVATITLSRFDLINSPTNLSEFP